MNHREKLAYLAGIIDGEGSICIWMNKKPKISGQFNIRVNVTSTDKILMDWLSANFGGSVYEQKSPSRCNPNWKKQWTWQVNRPQILQLLKELHSFLVIKKERCEIAIKFRETFSKRERNLSQETYNLRVSLFEQIKHLNHRGS